VYDKVLILKDKRQSKECITLSISVQKIYFESVPEKTMNDQNRLSDNDPLLHLNEGVHCIST
jgi:hypothetical protein